MSARTSLVTGGTGGLGTGVVQLLLERGDRVVVPWLDASEAEALRGRLPDDAEVELVEADVTDPARVRELAHHLEEQGGLDVLLNLVGGFTMAPLEETEPEDWTRMMELNARSAFLVTRAMAPLLRRSGRGAVVNVASAPAARGGGGGMAAYVTSKGAVISLTRALAEELKEDGITVNAVAPTTIRTEATVEAMPDADHDRWVTPAELGALMRFLTGGDARRLTGNVVVAGL
jgi:NAD(P)-dependent dehydrogenase (short-subunit alcohol dehydrogenase family)